MRRFYHFLSILIEIAGFILFTYLGWQLLDRISLIHDRSFRSLPILISLIIATLLHIPVHHLGYLLGGRLAGLQLIAFPILGKALVKEKGRLMLRERLPEQEILPVVMASSRKVSRLSWTIYFLGGSFANLLVMILSYLCLALGLVGCHTLAGSFLFGLFISGIWHLTDSLLPIYRMGQPGDMLKLLKLLSSEEDRSYAQVVGRWLLALSESDLKEQRNQSLETLPVIFQDKPVSLFAADYLIRAYEDLMWQGAYEEAGEQLKTLYTHRRSLPEAWYDLIIGEVISCLCLQGGQEQLDVSDMLVTDVLRSRLEASSTALSSRSLYLWSVHHVELGKAQDQYYKEIQKKVSSVPFAFARAGWIGMTVHG